MEDLRLRTLDHLFGRVDGPLAIRLLIQPIVASVLAVRDEIKDARQNHKPYGWSLLTGQSIADIGSGTAGSRSAKCFS